MARSNSTPPRPSPPQHSAGQMILDNRSSDLGFADHADSTSLVVGVQPGSCDLDPCGVVRQGDGAELGRRLRQGMPADLRCDEGWTLVELAAAGGQLEILKLLLAHGAPPGRLHCAVASGDARIVACCLEAGGDLEERDNAGFTPLHQAVCQGDRALVLALLKGGADATAEVGDCGPLALARRTGDPRLGGILRQRGARS